MLQGWNLLETRCELMASKRYTPESSKVGEGNCRPEEVGPTVGKGGVGK